MANKSGHKAVYGVGGCQPKPLQCLASPKAFTTNLAISIFSQVCIFAYAIGIVRTIEKRFGFSSQQTGGLSSVNDAIQVVVVLVIGYLARKAHKPRILSLSIMLMAVGSFMYSLPYFVYGSKEDILNGTSSQFMGCHLNTTDALCKKSGTQLVDSNNAAFTIFVCAALLIGIGGSGLQVMGISYIDENVKPEYSAIYISFATASFPLGPVVGFLVGALALSFPENLKSSILEKGDPAFIGAWWLGYAIFPVILFVFSIPIFFYPKHFPEYYAQKARRQAILAENGVKSKEAEAKEDITDKSGLCSSVIGELKEFPRSLYRMLSRPEYLTGVLANLTGMYVILGLYVNLPRYLETYFHQPASQANIITAVAGALSGVVGTLMAGIIVRKMRLTIQGKALMTVITSVANVIGIAVLMFISCDQAKLAGELDNNGLFNVDLSCAAGCSCSRDLFLPVCGATSFGDNEMQTFLTPCHAGCLSTNGSWAYSNCSCLATPEIVTTRGSCNKPCKMVLVYAAVMFVMSLFASLGRVPSMIVSLRVVDPELRTFALGVNSFFVNLLGFIPGPILFGTLIDTTCLVWSTNCGKTGNCLHYDSTKYRYIMHGATLVFVTISFFFNVLTWYFVRKNTRKGVYKAVDDEYTSTTVDIKSVDSKSDVTKSQDDVKNGTSDGSEQNNVISHTRL